MQKQATLGMGVTASEDVMPMGFLVQRGCPFHQVEMGGYGHWDEGQLVQTQASDVPLLRQNCIDKANSASYIYDVTGCID